MPKMLVKKTKKRGRPRTLWTPKAISDAAELYFQACDLRTKAYFTKKGEAKTVDDPAPYTIEGLCNRLSVTTHTFRAWCMRDDATGAKARMLRQRVQENRVSGALDSRQNPAFAKFMLTRNHSEDYPEKPVEQNSVDGELSSIFDEISGSVAIPGEEK